MDLQELKVAYKIIGRIIGKEEAKEQIKNENIKKNELLPKILNIKNLPKIINFKDLHNIYYNNMNIDNLSVKGVTAEGVPKMPPKPIFNDGCFYKKFNKLYYRFMFKREQICVSGYTKEECYQERLKIMTGERKVKLKTAATFGDWIDQWQKLYDKKEKNDKSLKQKQDYISRIKANLGKIPLSDLEGDAIQAFLNTYNNRTNTRKKITQIIKSAVKMGVTLRKIKNDPFAAIVIPGHKPKKRRPLTIDEQNAVYKNINKKYFYIFKFCCLTGLRISEALMLRKKDIDYETRQIFAKRLKKEEEVIAPVPFLPELLKFKFTDKLFEDVTYEGFKSYLEKLYAKLNIEGIMIHNFRSTFASLCYAAGIPLKYIQEWLCHTTLAMTADTYTHIIRNGNTSPLLVYIKKLKKHLKI